MSELSPKTTIYVEREALELLKNNDVSIDWIKMWTYGTKIQALFRFYNLYKDKISQIK